MTTAELLNKLSKKYPSPQYAFLSQVRNQTGYSSGAGSIRTADALALGLWKSRGYHLHGFELKISRSDWLHEFKDPSKAEAIAEYCDMFSLVIADMSIIDIAEVPKTWGIMVAQNGTVKTVREAPMLTPKPMDRAFLCGFMRNVTEQLNKNYVPAVEFDKKVEEYVAARIESAKEQASRDGAKYSELCERIRKFEDASGIPVTDLFWQWNKPEKIGEAVKMVMDGRHLQIKDELQRLVDRAENIAEAAKKEMAKL